jgi:hypothetical protein
MITINYKCIAHGYMFLLQAFVLGGVYVNELAFIAKAATINDKLC